MNRPIMHRAGFPCACIDEKGTRERPTRTAALGHRLAVLAQLSAAKYDPSTQRWSQTYSGRRIERAGVGILVWPKYLDKIVAHHSVGQELGIEDNSNANMFGGLAGGSNCIGCRLMIKDDWRCIWHAMAIFG